MSTRSSWLGHRAPAVASGERPIAQTAGPLPPEDAVRALLAHGITALLMIDEQRNVLTVNDSFRHQFLDGIDATGRSLAELTALFGRAPTGDLFSMVASAANSASAVTGSCATGWHDYARCFEVTATPLPSIRGVLVEATEISTVVHTAQTFGRDGRRDRTTDLLSRAGMLDWIQREMTDQPSRQLCVAMLQIDQFEVVDETLGPAVGDDLLAQVAAHLRQHLPPGSAAARNDRSSFCVAFPCASAVDADYRCAELRDAVRQPVASGGRTMRLTASVGASFVTDPRGAARSLNEATLGMLEARRRGGNRFAPYVPDEVAAYDGVLHKWDALSEALQYRQMEVWFQPMVSLATGQPIAAEALCRWHHPHFGEVSPTEFIPLAEWGAEILRLGSFVQDCAAEVSAAVRTATAAHARDFQVAINVSNHELAAPHFATGFLGRIMASGTRPDWFAVEVGEDALTADDELTMTNLRALAGAGVRVTVGDFGTGSSSVERLLAVPVSRLKIARSFVATMLDDPLSARVVASTIALARELKIEIVAEGVETATQAAELLRLGCNAAQGYLYAPAVPPTELVAVIADLAANARG